MIEAGMESCPDRLGNRVRGNRTLDDYTIFSISYALSLTRCHYTEFRYDNDNITYIRSWCHWGCSLSSVVNISLTYLTQSKLSEHPKMQRSIRPFVRVLRMPDIFVQVYCFSFSECQSTLILFSECVFTPSSKGRRPN